MLRHAMSRQRDVTVLAGAFGALWLLSCGPASARLPADVPDPGKDYHASVEAWMSEGTRVASGEGWATWRYFRYRNAHSLPNEMRTGFGVLCSRAHGRAEDRSCTTCPRGLRLCLSASRPLFGMSLAPIGDDSYQATHYTGSQVDELLANATNAQGFETKTAEERDARAAERAAESKQHTEAMRERTREFHKNLKPGDRGLVKNRKLEYARHFEEALVIEVKLPLVQVQLFNPQEAVWIEIEAVRAMGDGCMPGHDIC